ncbi:beta-class carbonic anhydrase [Anaeromyxobacter oryzae]|uniref:Carbonic anhydrase n=1 Tax=Anaeromyxobacter oryzae TaxID=2918170 RepID=A0ABN6MQU5_9BACT|nr:carbonic anhydrase [Anaeromyxobacter oryzae]BDG01995.1 carbonic anhydrase [Anaeromyxobacter oryzae]
MALLDELLEANQKAFHPDADPGSFIANRHLCIVTCVDPRLTHFFPDAIGVDRGHAVVIRVPGAHIAPGSEMLRALAASIYVNDCQEVLVLPHTDCGVTRVSDDELRRVMRARGVTEAAIPGDPGRFFGLIPDVEKAALETAEAIRRTPYLPRQMPVHAALLDIRTGVMKVIERGYEAVFR